MKNITILGTGAFGLSLALMFNKNDTNITMWSNFSSEIDNLKLNHSNDKLLPGIILPDEIKFTNDLKDALINTDLIVIAVPSIAVVDVLKEIKKIGNYKYFCLASKGIDYSNCRFLHEVIYEYFPTSSLAVISGPTFAIDIAKNAISGMSLATTDINLIALLEETLENDNLKLRATKDIIGVEICGAFKNILAIASGIIYGMKSTDTTKAMFLTETVNQIKDIIRIFGGDSKTINSFAGFGDILMTCTSTNSRNFTLGKMIGEKKDRNIIDDYINNTTVEGYITLKTVKCILNKANIKSELFDVLENIIINNKEPELILNWLNEYEKECH